jgi:single-stranded DNA-specific DHH superfamily exonuclease
MLLSNPKKRKLSVCSSFSEVDEDKVQKARRERNKTHAKRSRQRKKSLTGGLQQSLNELKEENVKLRGHIYAIIGQKKTDSMVDSMVDARLASPTKNVIGALKKPENRVVDSSTQAFLQGLRKKIPYHLSTGQTTL